MHVFDGLHHGCSLAKPSCVPADGQSYMHTIDTRRESLPSTDELHHGLAIDACTCRWTDVYGITRISVRNLTLVARHQGPLWWHGKIGKPDPAYWDVLSNTSKQGQGGSPSDGNNVSVLAVKNPNNTSTITRRQALGVKTGIKVLVVRPKFPSSCSGMVASTTCNAQVSGREVEAQKKDTLPLH
jgi:hypothetical protein